MNILIPKRYGYKFAIKIIKLLIYNIKIKLSITDFSIIDIWLYVEFDKKLSSEKIILYALKHIKIITSAEHIRIEFDKNICYPKTTIRLITLLKAITYGNRFFKGNKLLLDEFTEINKNIKDLYEMYKLTGVVL